MRIKVIGAFAGNLNPKQIKEIIKMANISNISFEIPSEIIGFYSYYYIDNQIDRIFQKVLEKEKSYIDHKFSYGDIFSLPYRQFIANILLEIEKENAPKPYHGFYSANQEQVTRSMTCAIDYGNGDYKYENLKPVIYYNAEGNVVIISEVNKDKKATGKWNDYIYQGIVYEIPPKIVKIYNKFISVEVYKRIITDHPNFSKNIIEFIMNS